MNVKRIACLALASVACLPLVSCGMQTYVPEKSEVIAVYENNSSCMLEAAEDMIKLDREVVVSHTDNYAIDSDDRAITEYKGLYISDTFGGYEKYQNENIESLLTGSGAKSISVTNSDGFSIVEFNCGGGGKYYRGVYYSSDNSIKNLVIPDGRLIASGDGFIYDGDEVYYYTEELDDCFFYYELNT